MVTGKVYLVGAGPGDPDLLTVQARRLIDIADVIMHDSLVSERIVESVPDAATVLDVGKKPGPDGERTTQAEINQRMVKHAWAGRTVVRLKGGDPNVYGRGGEEAEYLAAENVPFELVPGVTSAIAAPGVVGIPLTHRACASSVTVITGHETPTKEGSALNWEALSETVRAGGTLLILMGVRTLSENVQVLREHGVPADTPVAMIEKATLDGETTVTGTLETIVETATESDVHSPAITVVGDVVRVRDRIEEYLERGGPESPSARASQRVDPPLSTIERVSKHVER